MISKKSIHCHYRYAYVSNNPLKWIDPTGLAEIYSREMDSTHIPALGYANAMGFRHFLFRGGKRYGSGRFAIYQFHQGGISLFESYSPSDSGYKIIYSGLDDDLAEQAAAEVKDSGEFTRDTYKILANDCKDFANAIIEKYEELWRTRAELENEENEDFDVDEAWKQHQKEITARKGEVVEYEDANRDQLPEEPTQPEPTPDASNDSTQGATPDDEV